MNLKEISEGLWHDYDWNVDLIYSPDDNGYYFQHSNGRTSQMFSSMKDAEIEFTDGYIIWEE